MLPVLLEQDHRQQARAGPAARDHMKRRWRLADLLAVAAAEFLADMLDYLQAPRDHLQRLGDVLAQFAQSWAATAQTGCWPRLDHALARQMVGEGLPRRAPARERHDIRRLGHGPLGGDLVLTGRAFEFLERQLHLIQQPDSALRTRPVKLAPQLLDLQSLVRNHRGIVGRLGPGYRQFRLDLRRPGALGDQSCAQRTNVFRQVSAGGRHAAIESQIPALGSQKVRFGYPARCGRNVWRGFRQSIPSNEGLQKYPL